jgi:hypothetical protein
MDDAALADGIGSRFDAARLGNLVAMRFAI